MNTSKDTILLVIFLSFMRVQTLYGSSDIPASVEISFPKLAIHIGEPLVLKLTYKFEKPRKNAETGVVYESIRHSSALLIERKDVDNDWLVNYPDFKPFEKEKTKYYPLDLPTLKLNIQDGQGLEYSGYFLILYNHDKKDLVFDKSGTCKICVVSSPNKIFSNVIDLQINSQTQEKKCALLDHNYCDFLMRIDRQLFKGPEYYSTMMSDLKRLVEQCPDSILAKWAAARLGLESFYDAEKKRTKARREKIKLDDTLWDEAGKYLQKGLELPDDFAIRQEVLDKLCDIEYEKKNYSKVIFYIDELGTKYPQSRYGKKAIRSKNKLIELQKKESRQSP